MALERDVTWQARIDGGLETRRATPQPLAAAQRLVLRDALFERLSAPEGGGVVLVCAPAGSGKTMLLRSWIEAAGLQDRVGWVSVERGERDAQRFWLAVIDALAGAVSVVQPVAPAPTFGGRGVVDQLLSDLACLEEPAVLVIDDLHELGSADALSWLEVFLGRLPPALRVVLATREDPGLGLHRLRLAGQLTELRGSRPALLDGGDDASCSGRRASRSRTGAWRCSMSGRRGGRPACGWPRSRLRTIRTRSASSPSSPAVSATWPGTCWRRCWSASRPRCARCCLRTSVLDRVCGPLADFLTGGSGAERMLQELEDANAFVTSLDAGRSWFRYHHLFADLLQLELRRAAPAIVGSLHRAAAQWHEQEGYIVEAIRHAQAARDWLWRRACWPTTTSI